MTTRRINALILGLLVAATALALYWNERAGRERPGGGEGEAMDRVLAAVPADSFLVGTLDRNALRGSPLLEPLAAFAASLGKDAVVERCGFDPVERLDALAVAVPEEEGSGEFGLAMAGRTPPDELVACGFKLASDRGARLASDTVGSYTLVYGADTLHALTPLGKLALREGGPHLLGRGAWLEAMMAAAEGRRPRLADDERHRELRRALAAPGTAVLVTVLLPSELRERLKREMAGEEAMLGVLGVERAGLALGLGGPGGADLVARAELRCERAEDCAEVGGLIAAKRDAWSKHLGAAVFGLAGPLARMTVEHHDRRLTVRSDMPAADARRLLERLLALRAAPPGAPTARPPPSPPPVTPDEALTVAKDGGAAIPRADGGRR